MDYKPKKLLKKVFAVAVHLVVLFLLFALIIGSILFSVFSGQKIFFLMSFLLLMFGGVLIQSGNGVIIDQRPSEFTDAGLVVYEDVIVTLSDSTLYLFSQACFWVGLVLSCWLGLVSAFDFFGNKSRNGSPFSF